MLAAILGGILGSILLFLIAAALVLGALQAQ
jgi:hypothetical protein